VNSRQRGWAGGHGQRQRSPFRAGRLQTAGARGTGIRERVSPVACRAADPPRPRSCMAHSYDARLRAGCQRRSADGRRWTPAPATERPWTSMARSWTWCVFSRRAARRAPVCAGLVVCTLIAAPVAPVGCRDLGPRRGLRKRLDATTPGTIRRFLHCPVYSFNIAAILPPATTHTAIRPALRPLIHYAGFLGH